MGQGLEAGGLAGGGQAHDHHAETHVEGIEELQDLGYQWIHNL